MLFRSPPLMKNVSNTRNENIDDVASMSALERTEQLLYNTPLSIPIAYGNTNTKASDYVKALQMAMELKRPVHFVVYFDGEDEDSNKDLFDLSAENGIDGLIRRNIHRFLQTGRYMPVQVIIDMRDRTRRMINDIIMQQPPIPSNSNNVYRKLSKIEFHQQLAMIAGFDMNNERIIVSLINDNLQSPSSNRSNTDRPARVTTTAAITTPRQRPWDRPASAVRGYNGQLNNSSAQSKRQRSDTGPC